MSTHNAVLKDIETAMLDLGRDLDRAGAGYLASALYLASSKNTDTVFTLAHTGGDYTHYQRTDKYVYRRRLDNAQSAAAEGFVQNAFSMMASKMFPAHHVCLNTPVFPDRQAAPDRAMLQIVFDAAHSGIDKNSMARALQKNSNYRDLPGKVDALLQSIDHERDTALRVRDAYQPNAVVMFCDISNFQHHANAFGYYRAQDLADAFCQDFMKNKSEQHGAKLLRYEGDGLWLSFPFDRHTKPEQIQSAMNMAHDVTQHFPDFVKSKESGLINPAIKVVMELGEIRDYFWDARDLYQPQKPDDRSGPVFSHIRKATQKADKTLCQIVAGPELRAYLHDIKDTYNMAPNAFEIL